MIKATKVIQKAYRYWKFYIKDPKKRDEIMNAKSHFIQKFLVGYLARRKIMYDVMEASCEKTHQHFMKINKI